MLPDTYTYIVHTPTGAYVQLIGYIKWSTAVVVHFNYHIWVDPPGREERRREGRWRKER